MTPPDQTTREKPRADAPPAPTPTRAPAKQAGARRRRWRIGFIVLIAIGLILLIARLLAPGPKAGRTPPNPPQPVGVAQIGRGDLPVVLTGLGTVTPLATVTVQTQISGQLMSVGYREGQIVHAGDFLAQIDPRPYQVALAQAQATLARDTALLAQARSDLARYVTLSKRNSIAIQQLADQQFLVQQDTATVALDQASVSSARLNLVYCRITAPVTGRVGLRLVDPGNYVQAAGSTGLVVITQLQPISVVFVLPEENIPAIFQALRGSQTLAVDAYDRTDTTLLAHGTLLTVDNTVDTTTGTVKLRASFPNTDYRLFPNQFVNARLLLETLRQVVEAPTAAIQHGAPGSFVYLLKPNRTVAVQVVQTGINQGDETEITSGLQPGDTVVTDGVDRLRDGAAVKVTGAGTPPGEPTTPVPAEAPHHPHQSQTPPP